MNRKEKAAFLQETISTKGWEMIDGWLNQVDENIINNIKDNVVYLKADEMGKWGSFYSGQAEVIKSFRSFIKNTLTEPPKKKDLLADMK